MEHSQAKMHINIKVGVNLGDYNRIEIDAGLEDWVREGEHPEKTFDRIYNVLDKKIDEKLQDIKE